MEQIVIIPACVPTDGFGHISRSIKLMNSFPGRAVMYMPPGKNGDTAYSRLCLFAPGACEGLVRSLEGSKPDAYVLDNKATPLSFTRKLQIQAPVIALDEGGPSRAAADFTIDTLPVPDYFSRPNLMNPGFLDLPGGTRPDGEFDGSVLVTFGGSDPYRLTPRVLSYIEASGLHRHYTFTVCTGPGYINTEYPPWVNTISPGSNLAGKLGAYSLVIASFGLTAFEAAASNCTVMLLNPTSYHEELARKTGFYSLGIGNMQHKSLENGLNSWSEVRAVNKSIISYKKDDFAGYLHKMHPVVPVVPPGGAKRVVRREASRTFYRSKPDGSILTSLFAQGETAYAYAYFNSEYKAQYGKTYEEDLPAIRQLMRKRIDTIHTLKQGGTLLDAGCALGACLLEAADSGYKPYGLDISAAAVSWCRDHGLHAQTGCVMDFAPETAGWPRQFDIVTLWYVIEHMKDITGLLRRLNGLLVPGGILAVSTPNGAGISARTMTDSFLHNSPDDHYYIFTPKSLKRIAARSGFKTRSVRVTGHHPERFPAFFSKMLKSPVRAFLSRILGLGDTFEIYFEKTGETRE